MSDLLNKISNKLGAEHSNDESNRKSHSSHGKNDYSSSGTNQDYKANLGSSDDSYRTSHYDSSNFDSSNYASNPMTGENMGNSGNMGNMDSSNTRGNNFGTSQSRSSQKKSGTMEEDWNEGNRNIPSKTQTGAQRYTRSQGRMNDDNF